MTKKITQKITHSRSIDEIYNDIRKRIKARRKYEEKVKKELEWGDTHIETNDNMRTGTRLDRSRILKTDEDNLY